MNRRSDIEALTPGLRRYARGLTGCAETADDLTQDALLSAIRSSGLGRGSALRRRLYAILTDFNRMRVAGLSNPDAYGGENRGVVRLFNRRDGAAAIASGPDPLAAMSLGEREALLLVAVESFAYDEAADILGVSRPALIARLARARGEKALTDPDRDAAGRGHLRIVS